MTPWPVALRVRRRARTLQIDFDDGQTFELPAGLLRAMTPSAQDRGHRGGAEGPLDLETGTVALVDAQPVGAYAVRLVFDDGHDTGLYTWEALYRMGGDKTALMAEHRRLLAQR